MRYNQHIGMNSAYKMTQHSSLIVDIIKLSDQQSAQQMNTTGQQQSLIFITKSRSVDKKTSINFNKQKTKLLTRAASKIDQSRIDKSHPRCRQGSHRKDEPNLHLRMKDKFEELYKKLKKISSSSPPPAGLEEHRLYKEQRYILKPSDQIGIKKQAAYAEGIREQLNKFSFKNRADRIKNENTEQEPEQKTDIQINMVSSKETSAVSIKLLRNTRYKPRLVSLRPINMSNNIKDYLSIQKIRLQDLEDQPYPDVNCQYPNSNPKFNNLLNETNMISSKQSDKLQTDLMSSTSAILASQNKRQYMYYHGHRNYENSNKIKNSDRMVESISKLSKQPNNQISKPTQFNTKKFIVPFETYYYRDLVWKVGYSNEQIREPPNEYDAKVKVFIGKGNNFRLIKSIINRRTWLQATDKIEEAAIVWTQIKVGSVFAAQLKAEVGGADQEERQEFRKQKLKACKDNTHYTLDSSIWTQYEESVFRKYWAAYKSSEQRTQQSLKFRTRTLKVPKTTPVSHSIRSNSPTKLPLLSAKSSTVLNTTTTSALSPLPPSSTVQCWPRIKIHNHLKNNYLIGNKKALFRTMSDYYAKHNEDVFSYLPLTFHICQGVDDQNYLKFLNVYHSIAKINDRETKEIEEQVQNSQKSREQPIKEQQNQSQKKQQQPIVKEQQPKSQSKLQINEQTQQKVNEKYWAIQQSENLNKFNAWIVKPGQNSNRGQGITVCLDLQSIRSILKKKQKYYDGTRKTYIIQKYLERPLLYKKRKFDIRHYIMISCSNRLMKGYWFKEGYARTTSSEYTLKQGTGSIHLTNDAVQKNLPDYGKFEKGNKVSYNQLNEYIKQKSSSDFWRDVYPQMKKIAIDVIKASAHNLDPERRSNNFEIFGLDFMLDQRLKVWLIEVNTNPCLQISCPLQAKMIPKLIEDTFQIVVDPIYPAPISFNPKSMAFKKNCSQEMGYELVYDQRWEEKNSLGQNLLNDEKLMKSEEDCFDDDGEELNED